LAIAAGYDGVLSNSREPQALKDLAEELGPQARAATPAGAAAAGDLVVVSIPPRALPGGTGGAAGRQAGPGTPSTTSRRIQGLGGSLSSSEVLQRHLGPAPAVKVFNNITFWHLASLARAAGATDRSALPIAADDSAAKAAVTEFLDAIGYDAGTAAAGGVDAQVLAEHPQQPGALDAEPRGVGHHEDLCPDERGRVLAALVTALAADMAAAGQADVIG
jgi:8-hydroxy-5-deazaflavin:NADPH oxidoreductase